MPVEVVMPRLGWTMEEGTLVEWLKSPGERVETGDLLFTVESDKALNEVEAFDAGILHIPGNAPDPGDTVPVGTVLAYLLAEGESPPAVIPPRPEAARAAAHDLPAPVPGQESDDALAPAPGSSSVPAPVPPAPGAGRPAISPRARRLARELGVDWQRLAGTGRTGRITEEDVRAAARQGGDGAAGDDVERLPMSPIRRAIAARLAASHREGAPVTLTAEIDASALVELRRRTKPRPAYNDYLIRFTALALERCPALNSSLHGDDIHLHRRIHVGFAVDTEAGLLVPVVRDANRKSVDQIAGETVRLGGRALRGELTREEMEGATFTITNLGAAGIDAFTPLLNPPQSAILGIGRIAQRPAVHEGRVVPRWLTVVSLTFDHRLVDGGPAAGFLAALRELVHAPATGCDAPAGG